MEILEVTITLRKAELWDVFHHGFNKRMGQPFWVKSPTTGLFDNKAYIVEPVTNGKELKAWVDQGMLYVPASDLDLKQQRKQPAAQVKQSELSLTA